MPKDGSAKTQGLYDRIAEVQNLAMKLNGYRDSVARYLRSLDLKINENSLVLDAGCGTGLVTLAFQDAKFRPRHIAALDLSLKSLNVAREAFSEGKRDGSKTSTVQGDVLKMPFGEATFDLVMMCGVLEYTPLDAGLAEAARVMRSGASLVLLPVKPSIVGSVLELLYNFKIHPVDKVRAAARNYFNIVGNFDFPIIEPIAWSKTIFLLEKK